MGKPLGPIVGQPPGILGSTIVGDGRVALILDPPGLLGLLGLLEPESAGAGQT